MDDLPALQPLHDAQYGDGRQFREDGQVVEGSRRHQMTEKGQEALFPFVQGMHGVTMLAAE
jgi:hypothetical protein